MTSIDVIERNFYKLEDILNSTESLMGKIGQLQVDLFNNPDKDLEKFLNEINNAFSESHEKIEQAVRDYENNKVLPAKGE
jgi:ABC-type transporter Mla subunit MlaD